MSKPKFGDIIECIKCGDTHKIDNINLKGTYYKATEEDEAFWVCDECCNANDADNYTHSIDDEKRNPI